MSALARRLRWLAGVAALSLGPILLTDLHAQSCQQRWRDSVRPVAPAREWPDSATVLSRVSSLLWTEVKDRRDGNTWHLSNDLPPAMADELGGLLRAWPGAASDVALSLLVLMTAGGVNGDVADLAARAYSQLQLPVELVRTSLRDPGVSPVEAVRILVALGRRLEDPILAGDLIVLLCITAARLDGLYMQSEWLGSNDPARLTVASRDELELLSRIVRQMRSNRQVAIEAYQALDVRSPVRAFLLERVAGLARFVRD